MAAVICATHRSALLALVLLALAWLGCVQRAHADRSWDGFEGLVELAGKAHLQLLAPAEVSLSQVSGRDALLIVNPLKALPVGALSTFLREGGRVALLDDFGSGGRFLSAYQVERGPAPGSGPALRNNKRLLIAYPRSEHPLAEGVPLLLTNDAASLRHPELKPVFVFGHSESALVLAGAVGAGRLVAVGDASLVINQLMELPAHQRFAQNLLEYLSRDGGKIWLVGPDTKVTGSFGDDDKPGAAWLDGVLRRAAHPDLPPAVLALIALSLAAIAAVIALNALPRKSPYLRAALFPDDTVYAGFAGRVALSRQAGSNLIWPLLDLKHEVEAELSYRLGLLGHFDPEQALLAARKRGLDKSDLGALSSLLGYLAEQASRAESDTERVVITAAELTDRVRQAELLLARLGSDKA